VQKTLLAMGKESKAKVRNLGGGQEKNLKPLPEQDRPKSFITSIRVTAFSKKWKSYCPDRRHDEESIPIMCRAYEGQTENMIAEVPESIVKRRNNHLEKAACKKDPRQ